MRQNQTIHLLHKYLSTQRLRVLLLAILLLGGIGLQLIHPQIVRHFIDSALSGGATDTLIRVALLFLGVAALSQVLAVATTYVSETVGWTAIDHLREDLALHCLRLDMSFHNDHTPGELIQRIDGDVNALTNFFSEFVIQLFGNLVLIVGILAVLFLEDWRVGTGLTIFTALTLAMLARLWPASVPSRVAAREVTAQFSGFLEERLAGTEDICANGGQLYVMQSMFNINRQRLVLWRRANIIGALTLGVTFTLLMILNAIGLALGTFLYMQEAVTLGTVYMIFHYTTLLSGPLFRISHQVDDLQKATAGMQRVLDLFQRMSSTQPVHTLNSDSQLRPLALGVAPTVQFQNVSFAYAMNRPVLHDLSFEIESGQALGLLGRTGSGKTTIMRLLTCLHAPSLGTICLNDMDTSQVALSELRQQVGVVTQDVQLFHASIRNNLTFFNPHVRNSQLFDVLEQVGLQDWFDAQPLGLDTRLDPSALSAGEAQLLAFARIFLKDPGLVILDEASSRLDPTTEKQLEHVLERLLQGRTSIIIAHRLATVQRADQIMIIKDGQILEMGARRALAAVDTSIFYRLLQTGLELDRATEVVIPEAKSVDSKFTESAIH